MNYKFLLIIVIVFSGAIIWNNVVEAQQVTTGYEECTICEEEGFDPVYSDNFSNGNGRKCAVCIRGVAIKLNDVTGCNRISNNGMHLEDKCFRELALKNQDSSFCHLFYGGNEDSIRNKERNCLLYLSLTWNDSALCEEFDSSQYKSDCYRSVAYQTSNPQLCEKVLGALEPTRGPNMTKESCYESLASKLSDPSLCDLAGHLKEECHHRLSGLNTKEKRVIRHILTGLFLIITMIAFILRRRLSRALLGLLLGASIASAIYVLGYFFINILPLFIFISRFLLLGIPIVLNWIIRWFLERSVIHLDYFGFNNWLSFVLAIITGGLLGYIAGGNMKKIVKIVLFLLYIVITGIFLLWMILSLSSFS